MTTARTRHAATLLTSGQVLLAGGFDGANVLQSAEIYSGGSSGASFAPTSGSMTTARDWYTASILASGKVLLAGGTSGTSAIASGEVFDLSSGTFTSAGSMVVARSGAGSALLQDGTVLIEGGRNGATVLSSAEIFSPDDGLTPTLASLGLTAPAAASFASTQTASIQLPAGASCIWWVENGTFNSAANGTLTFTMGPNENTTVHVLVYTDIGLPITDRAVVIGQ